MGLGEGYYHVYMGVGCFHVWKALVGKSVSVGGVVFVWKALDDKSVWGICL